MHRQVCVRLITCFEITFVIVSEISEKIVHVKTALKIISNTLVYLYIFLYIYSGFLCVLTSAC